ncbi:MAG TPA: DUF6602 domain-containing protein [Chryseobacterium sp.]
MADSQSQLKIQLPNQGWKQFLTARDEMLSAYDRARIHSSKNPVQTKHGLVAEAELRKWLINFLPKRYGVTSGYIISQGIPNSENFIHYDVIIYDQLESPILWLDDSADSSNQGKALAIPVEYVKGVIEVKSAFNKKAAKKAVGQLSKLKPLLSKIDSPNHAVKMHLPAKFFCATVFFELREEDELDFSALDELVEAVELRGFYGGYILRANSLDKYYSGKITLLKENSDVAPENQTLTFWSTSKCKKIGENFYKILLDQSESHFSEFAFDLIALLKGSYHPNILSSLYGMGTTQWGQGSAVDRRYLNPNDVKRYNEEIENYWNNLR